MNLVSASQHGSPVVCREQQDKALGTEFPAKQKHGVFGCFMKLAGSLSEALLLLLLQQLGCLSTESRLKPATYEDLGSHLKLSKNSLKCRGMVYFAPIFL